MSKSYTVMELEAIKKLCKSVNLIANLPTDLIADTNVATNTTYSSYRIDAEMSALETDIQAYVDTALAGLNKLTKEIINDKALVVKDNVLYLYKADDDTSNNYMQMMLINGVAIELGSTTCDFSSVYSKDDVDAKFALKIDLDMLTTSFNNLVTSVENKVDKANIVTVLDDTATDEQVASAKGVWDIASKGGLDWSSSTITLINENDDLDSYTEAGTYRCKSKTISSTLSNSPINNSAFKMEVTTGASDFLTQYILVSNNADFKPLMRTKNSQGLWGAWQRVCGTTVDDEANVDVTSSLDTAVATINSIAYTVKNGICYVRVNNLKPLVTCNETVILPNGTLPNASTSLCYASINTWSETDFSSILLQPNTNGSLDLWCNSNALNKAHYGMFSYPVAE